jgi:ABC-type amino acid transport substrate-binding protein
MLRRALVQGLALVPLTAGAAGRLDEIRERGVLRVSVKNEGAVMRTEHNDPAHFQKRGFEIELAGLIAERLLGDASKLDLQTFKQRDRLPAVAAGEVDLGISMFAVTPENEAIVDFSAPYHAGGLAVMQKSAANIRTLEELAGKRIVAMQQRSHDPGGDLEKLAGARGVAVKVERVSSFADGIARIEAGEADGMVAANANLDAFIADGYPDYRRSPLLSRESYAVAVRKGERELLAAVDELIAELRTSGRLAAMTKKWGLPAE